MYFLTNIDAMMRQKEISRSEFAREVGIAPSTINSWYNKGYENISLRFLIKISKYFNVTIDELLNKNLDPHDDTAEIVQKFLEFYRTNQAK